eukprot:222069_1
MRPMKAECFRNGRKIFVSIFPKMLSGQSTKFSNGVKNTWGYLPQLSGIQKMVMAAVCFLATLLILLAFFGQRDSPPDNCSGISVRFAEEGYVIPQFDSEDMMALNSTMTVPCMHPLVDTVMHLNCTTAGEVYMEYLDCPP